MNSSAQHSFDRRQVEREVMSVLDAFIEAFNRQDAQAEERTYHFPHYRLANGLMSSWAGPGAEIESWMNGTYKTLRESGWGRSSWTRRRVVHLSDAKAHVDTEITRYRNDGSVITKVDSLYVLTKEAGRWGIKMRSSLDTVIAAPVLIPLCGPFVQQQLRCGRDSHVELDMLNRQTHAAPFNCQPCW